VRPRTFVALTGAAAVAAALATTAPASAQQSDGSPSVSAASKAAHRSDNRPGPRSAEQARLRAKALSMLRTGKAELKPQKGGGSTVTLTAPDGSQESVYFAGASTEAAALQTDQVFTILAEFGTSGSGKLGTVPGPLHNQIPQPDRAVDNSTYWVEDFSRAHYETMFNSPTAPSFRDFYLKQSGGKYTALNSVSNWVTVPGNASSYGDNAVEDLGGSWAFVADSANAWYDAQVAAGQSDTQIKAYLATLDRWDRYDFDGDGNFTEPDGYIDHFQAVHAGGGEEAGAGEDAIWSHRWYVNPGDEGVTGPSDNRLGGTQIGTTGMWIGDYTVEPENGGLGVFAHEFGHDLGLPDYYDTNGGENGTGFWTLMSSGSWLNEGEKAGDAIGTTPGGFGPEEKLFLGWLDHSTVAAKQSGDYVLNASQNTVAGKDQAVKVNLPDSERTEQYVTPPEGTHAWWSGRGDDLKNTLVHEVPEATSVTVSADVWRAIEENYDYLYVEYSTDGGDHWTTLAALTGDATKWTSKKWSYKPENGAASQFRFRYATDGGYNEAGAFLDNISITSGKTYAFTDGAEAGTGSWKADGWSISTGTEVTHGERYYLLENRQYVGYDHTLEVGPYQFSEAYTRPDWVERFAYQKGMLVWLVDQGWADNNTIDHQGSGYAIPVDARPDTLTYSDGTSPSNRREPFDATFGLHQLDGVCLHKQVAVKAKGKTTIETLAACNDAATRAPMATFDDSKTGTYWASTNPLNSVKVAGVGVTATVTAETGTDLTVHVVNPAPKP
jgi:immune inhibitor A